jgi:hypothetical protein
MYRIPCIENERDYFEHLIKFILTLFKIVKIY